jgi:hypothetical protein
LYEDIYIYWFISINNEIFLFLMVYVCELNFWFARLIPSRGVTRVLNFIYVFQSKIIVILIHKVVNWNFYELNVKYFRKGKYASSITVISIQSIMQDCKKMVINFLDLMFNLILKNLAKIAEQENMHEIKKCIKKTITNINRACKVKINGTQNTRLEFYFVFLF